MVFSGRCERAGRRAGPGCGLLAGASKALWDSPWYPNRLSGPLDGASTLRSDRSYSFPVLAVKWEDRRAGGCVFQARPGTRLSEPLKMKRVRTAVRISGPGGRSALESWLHPLTRGLPQLMAQAL